MALPIGYFVVALIGHAMAIPTSATTSPLDCDFEGRGLCGWTKDSRSTLTWELRTGKVMTKGQTSSAVSYAPHYDHTLDNYLGHFLYVDKTYRFGRDKRAGLKSPPVNIPDTGVCFRFWYHMYGPHVARLNVFVTGDDDDDDVKSAQKVWTKDGTQGPDWKPAQIHIQNVTGKAFLTVEIVSGSRLQNPALDDFRMNYGPCPPSNACDFEDDRFCSYTQSSTTDDFDWIVSSPGSSPHVAGPKTDHTFGTNEGHFAHIDATSATRVKGQTAVLDTNSFPATTGSCLSFWYCMRGEGVGILNIKTKSLSSANQTLWTKSLSSANQTLWTKSGNQGVDWQMASVTLKSEDSYSVVFEGTLGSDTSRGLAIDDVTVTNGICPNTGSCDFESDICAWRNDLEGDDLDWTRETGNNLLQGFPPPFDHTFNNYLGHYLYLDPGRGRNTRVSKFVSPSLNKGDIYCLNAWYSIGDGEGNLTVATRSLGSEVEEGEIVSFNSSASTSDYKWKNLRLVIEPLATDFSIVIIGTVTRYKGGIAIDDVHIQDGNCESVPSPEPARNVFRCPEGNFLNARQVCDFHEDCLNGEDEKSCGYDCDFEKDTTCEWEVSETGKYTWSEKSIKRQPGAKKGYSLYLETKAGGRGTDEALLLSPFFQRSAPNCELVFSLLYHGVKDEDVTVKKIEGIEEITLFEARGDYGTKWKTLVIPLQESEVPFRVVVSGKRAGYGDDRGSIAIDDILFKNCDFPQPNASCTTGNTFQCNNGACVHPSEVCNFADNCGDESDETETVCSPFHRCGFEEGLCDWSQERQLDDFDFNIEKGTVLGPYVDHTTGTEFGHFLLTDTANMNRLHGDKAWLLSPVLEQSTSCLLNFYLYMHGEHTEDFSVYIRSETQGKLKKVFTKSNETGNFWVFHTIPLKSSIDFQIILEVISGNGRKGKIAIDDVILSPGCNYSSEPLPSAISTPSPTPSECGHEARWRCRDGSWCILKTEVCDFVSHCDDGSDELNCGACDFETSMCGWRDRTRGRYVWDRVNASSMGDIEFKPETGHGGRGDGESFALVHDKGSGYFRPGLLESPVLGSTEDGCSIRFRYILDNSNGYLYLRMYPKEVTSYERNNGVALWSSDRSAVWKEKYVSIGARAAGFRLVFKYNSHSPLRKTQFGAAIDDISFSPDCGATKTPVYCSQEEFACGSSRDCKPASTRCDLTLDCPNGEDEEECENYNLRCDFENGLEFFTADSNVSDSLSWVIRQPNSSVSDNAPDRDHTRDTSSGHYVYLDSSMTSSKIDDHVARVRGPVMFGNPEGRCRVRFFYSMKGDYSDSINVYTETHDGGRLVLKWRARSGAEVKGGWTRADVQLLEHSLLFRLVIEGVGGPGYLGDIGIDDVTFTPHCVKAEGHVLPPGIPVSNHGQCKSGVEFLCDGKCAPVEKWCDFKKDCKDGTDEASCPSWCDFETGLCGWKSESDRDTPPIIWERKTASEVQLSADHDLGSANGHLMSTTVNNDKLYVHELSFVSPLFRSSSYTCSFSFWLLEQSNRPNLQLKLRSSGHDGVVWVGGRGSNSKPSQKATWRKESVALPPCQTDFQLVLYLKALGKDSLSLFLDDVAFQGCSLEEPTTAACHLGEFQCSNGQCVPEDRLCDLNNDCCDWSDETHVTCQGFDQMTMEMGLGGWKHKVGAHEWSKVKAEKEGSGGGTSSSSPRLDHTFSSSAGHYLHSDCSGTEPRIIQHEMPKPVGSCMVLFWYAIVGKSSGVINVLAKTVYGDIHPLASYTTSVASDGTWVRAEVEVNVTERYDLILEGKCGKYGYGSSINLDDIVFGPGCQNKSIETPFTIVSTPTVITTPTSSTNPNSCRATNQFRCVRDSSCIAHGKVCDSKLDCADGSDEAGCPTSSTNRLHPHQQDLDDDDTERYSDEDWHIAVGVVFTVFGIIGIVAAVIAIRRKLNRSGGARFSRFQDTLSDDVSPEPAHNHVTDHADTVHYQGGDEVATVAFQQPYLDTRPRDLGTSPSS